ncbi:P-loop containing nucleoside triphosphate hydrolase protein [Roridomyces roridus]|uniref:P-loop containing nucleoside triphosphate hydrolase protein n=1 Tax=Roridomyces roridus TaxID=1738132 RepID=A0AAD7CJA6_9AGAR|nr:P-loop containing nucleoside triphosphate hydrolase protein [Roridomyces roridus]
MSDSHFSVVQNLYRAPHPSISVETHPRATLTRSVLAEFVRQAQDYGVIGVAPAYGTKCALSVLALSSERRVLLIPFGRRADFRLSSLTQDSSGDLLEDIVFCADSCTKVAFHMDVLAASLYRDHKLRIRGGHDRHSLQAIMNCMGGEVSLHKPNVISLFSGEERQDEVSLRSLALRAWVAWRAATLGPMAQCLLQEPHIDTDDITEARLSALSKLVRDASRLSALKPTSVENEVADEYSYDGDQLHVLSTRFKNRLRMGPQAIEIQATDRGRQVTVSGQATHVDGRAAQIKVGTSFTGPIKITTIGKERATSAEGQREDIILKALQGRSAVPYQPFFQAIWLPEETPSWPRGPLFTGPMSFPSSLSFQLNASQKLAVDTILSDEPTAMIHGPPGTGKTTVIAAAVLRICADWDRTVWLVAQSNVAVKNIAEKLASVGFFDFKILVSQEFHYDWHEHLYEKIKANLIRSDEFSQEVVETERQLLNSRVILCTLSMLSTFRIATITRIVPVETLIVDEASQVEIGSFIPVISRFSKPLKKIVFIGDDKQLAPYGQEDIEDLQSVFEMKHLRKGSIFLDTQYRSVDHLPASNIC